MKRMVWNAVSTRKVEAAKDASSFANVATNVCKSVTVTFVACEELEAAADLLGLKKCFSTAPAIAKFHSLKPLKNGLILCRFYSYQSTWVEMGVQIPGSEDEDIDQSDSDEAPADEEDSGKEEGDCISNVAKCSSYEECSSQREEEDSASDADEDGSREEEEEDSVSGEERSSGPDEEKKGQAMRIKVQVTRKKCQSRLPSKLSRAFLISCFHYSKDALRSVFHII